MCNDNGVARLHSSLTCNARRIQLTHPILAEVIGCFVWLSLLLSKPKDKDKQEWPINIQLF